MAEASLALAERRPDDLKAAAEKLGQPVPSGRQLLALRVMGIVAPPPGSPFIRRAAGVLALLLFIVAVLALGFALVKLIALPFGGLSTGLSIFWGFLLICVALGALAIFGRRKQKKALAARSAPR